MEADDCGLAALKPRLAQRGSLRVFSVVGGLALLASPAVDTLMRRDAAKTQLPTVVAAELDGHHEIEWTKMRPGKVKPSPGSESCDHECRTWSHELAAHVSFGY